MTIATLALAATALGMVVVWLAVKAVRVDTTSPDRLVMELRLAQVSALLLVLTAGGYVGAAVAQPGSVGAGLDVALATGFFVLAALATTWEPARALTALAAGWAVHGLIDLGHLAQLVPSAVVPPWYPTACAIYGVGIAGVCYLPVLRR